MLKENSFNQPVIDDANENVIDRLHCWREKAKTLYSRPEKAEDGLGILRGSRAVSCNDF